MRSVFELDVMVLISALQQSFSTFFFIESNSTEQLTFESRRFIAALQRLQRADTASTECFIYLADHLDLNSTPMRAIDILCIG